MRGEKVGSIHHHHHRHHSSMAAAIIGWYGPLIDLSTSSSHIDGFVQLLVFVHSSHPIQKDYASDGGTLLKTVIQVGDETRSYFSVYLWPKHMASMVVAGDIILLENVKITKFKNDLEATALHISSLLVLVHSTELGASKGIDELVAQGKFGETVRAKLRRVVNWVHRTESALQHVQNRKGKIIKNWKAHEEKKSRDCLSISEALRLTNSCHANFHAHIGEIVLPFVSKSDQLDDELLFVSKRLFSTLKDNIVEDFISEGCKLCATPVVSRSVPEQIKFPLYCKNSSNYHHDICQIYRPFMLYLWDQSGQIPVLVKNKAAEILFANITAENVYRSYQEVKKLRPDPGSALKQHHHSNPKEASSTQVDCNAHQVKPNFYQIWLILVKSLLQHGENSPFRFEICVDIDKDVENGRFELVSFSMPCNETDKL